MPDLPLRIGFGLHPHIAHVVDLRSSPRFMARLTLLCAHTARRDLAIPPPYAFVLSWVAIALGGAPTPRRSSSNAVTISTRRSSVIEIASSGSATLSSTAAHWRPENERDCPFQTNVYLPQDRHT